MKRSEMIKIMATAHSRFDSCGHPYDYDDLADYVLSSIEQAGMLPPCNTEHERSLECIYGESIAGRKCTEAILHKGSIDKYEYLDIWDKYRKTYYNKVYSSYRWEPEDE